MKFDPKGDIFAQNVDAIINPVNCRGVMGKGLALAFKKRFPGIIAPYQKVCAAGALRPGMMQMIKVDRKTGQRSSNGDLTIINLPTKDDWRKPSDLSWIDMATKKLPEAMAARDISSIAIPQLGAGLGGLEWKDVARVIIKNMEPAAKAGCNIVLLGPDPLAHERQATISEFVGDYRFLSPAYRCFVPWGDEISDTKIYPCAALPLLLARTDDLSRRQYIENAYHSAEKDAPGAGAAALKDVQNEIVPSDRYLQDRKNIIGLITWNKFSYNKDLAVQLKDTAPRRIVNGTRDGDIDYGLALEDIPSKTIKAGDGHDYIGRTIMVVRNYLMEKEGPVKSTLSSSSPSLTTAKKEKRPMDR